MAVSCNTNDLAEAGKCFCFEPRVADGVELYLLAVIAGGSLDPATLVREAAAAGFLGIGDKATREGLRLYLLCQAADGA